MRTGATIRSTCSCTRAPCCSTASRSAILRDLEGLPAADLSRDDVSFHALLEYQPGDDLRHVHWRSTARTGTMMVRQYEETRRSHFVIGLSRSSADYATADDFELAISAAGSIGLRALRDSQRVDMRVQGRDLPSGTGQAAARLALGRRATASRATAASPNSPASLAATMPLASVVVLVCGSKVSSDELRLACSRLPFGARVLAVVDRHHGVGARRCAASATPT